MCFNCHPGFFARFTLSPPVAARSFIVSPTNRSMAAFVSPQHQAVLNEMDRIVAAADSHASVLEILNAGPVSRRKSFRKSSGPTSNWRPLRGGRGNTTAQPDLLPSLPLVLTQASLFHLRYYHRLKCTSSTLPECARPGSRRRSTFTSRRRAAHCQAAPFLMRLTST